MDEFKEVTSGTARVAFNDGSERRETEAEITLHDSPDPRDLFTQRVISREGSDITTGMAHVGDCEPLPTGYERLSDESLAMQLSGIFVIIRSPSNRDLIREAQLRLVARGADGRGNERMTKPTLEGLERRLEQLERDIKAVTGIDPRQMTNAD